MKITFQVSATLLSNGSYQPNIILLEDMLKAKSFTGFSIQKVCSTKEDAINQAKAHARNEAYKRYGKNTEVNVEIVD